MFRVFHSLLAAVCLYSPIHTPPPAISDIRALTLLLQFLFTGSGDGYLTLRRGGALEDIVGQVDVFPGGEHPTVTCLSRPVGALAGESEEVYCVLVVRFKHSVSRPVELWRIRYCGFNSSRSIGKILFSISFVFACSFARRR